MDENDKIIDDFEYFKKVKSIFGKDIEDDDYCDEKGYEYKIKIKNGNFYFINFKLENIDFIPVELLKFKHLENLDIFDYNHSSLPDWISDFEHLKRIDIYNSNLKTLPENFFNLLNLEQISIQRSKLYHLSEKINRFKKLNSLLLDSCKIDKIPSTIGDLNKLEFLSFKRCQVTKLPNSMKNLKNLKELFISDNPLKEFPLELMFNLEKLEILDVRGISFEEIPIEIRTHPSLEAISFSNSLIKKKPEGLTSGAILPWRL